MLNVRAWTKDFEFNLKDDKDTTATYVISFKLAKNKNKITWFISKKFVIICIYVFMCVCACVVKQR